MTKENFEDALFNTMDTVPDSMLKDITNKDDNYNRNTLGRVGISPKEPSLKDAASHTAQNSFEDITDRQNSFDNSFSQNNLPPVNSQQMNAGNLITGDMAVMFLDMLLPALIVALMAKAGKQVSKSALQASAKEKEIIAPVLQNYLNSINFAVDNPLNALMITLAMIYGTKTVEALNGAKFPMQRTYPTGNGSGGIVDSVNKNGTVKKDGRGRPRKTV